VRSLLLPRFHPYEAHHLSTIRSTPPISISNHLHLHGQLAKSSLSEKLFNTYSWPYRNICDFIHASEKYKLTIITMGGSHEDIPSLLGAIKPLLGLDIPRNRIHLLLLDSTSLCHQNSNAQESCSRHDLSGRNDGLELPPETIAQLNRYH
jgi:hypothetical protein